MLDFQTINRTIDLPSTLDFDVQFEPTRVSNKKYAINGTTGQPFAVVGDTFNCASHKDFFTGVWEQITENLHGCRYRRCRSQI